MKKSLVILTSVISLLGFTTQTYACLISSYSRHYAPQYDIPSTYDLAISKLPIHSNAYYQWIIQNNFGKIKNNQMTLDDYDDLAVSYNKVGEKEKAIELLIPIVKDNPQRFSSISNLGSIYLNIGDYENGLKYLRIANTLNPVDNYDREYAQEKVYSYLNSRHKTLPYSFPIQDIESGRNFADFALKDIPEEKQNDEIIRLIFGIENMVRFGNHDSPVSMEVLGDLYLKFKNINNLNDYGERQLNDNINNFYNAAYIKSSIKNNISLLKITEKNHIDNNEVFKLKIENDFQKVKEERIALEEKEKQIILEDKDIERILNEDLISKDNNNQKLSIMNEKEKLNQILITKHNRVEGVKYLQYIDVMNSIAWILLIFSAIGGLVLIWLRQKNKSKYIELQNYEFNGLNHSTQFMNKTIMATIGAFIIIMLNNAMNNQWNPIMEISLLLIKFFSFFSILFLIIASFLLAFKKYENKDNYHLKSRKNMRFIIVIALISASLFITGSLGELVVYSKYEYTNALRFVY